jgi:hypothetical protein
MKRPDGSDPAAYGDPAKWPPDRWAWEFLRRNEQFLAACKAVKDEALSIEHQLGIAETFHLKRFKPAAEPYSGAGFKKALFKVSAVSFWTRLNESDEAKRPRTLLAGEMAVLLDLNAALFSKRALEKQLAMATRLATKQLAQLVAARGMKLPTHKVRKDGLFELLRILDADAAGTKHREIFIQVFPNKAKTEPASGAAWRETFKPLIKRARKLAAEDYLKLTLAG